MYLGQGRDTTDVNFIETQVLLIQTLLAGVDFSFRLTFVTY